ncbi:STT3 domain-containing protein [Haloarcula litorea]|uniref:STT3 domain-containing protein n=1 Tax=Haloarcula litorea TaxID=3032579 RepID=UPI0023E80E8B|nr:STT3 domain-containing protein [Halomicroarcula sp. GDY20]
MDEQVREQARTLLEDRPELRSDLRAILEQDEHGPWSFQDVPVDSGAFGEIVSAELVEETDDGYRVRDPDALSQVLDAPDDSGIDDTGDGISVLSDIDVSFDTRRLGALAAALLFVALVRTALIYPAVFRDGTIVLAGNDPYMYHEAVEILLSEGPSAFTLGGLSDLAIEFLSSEIRTHDTLLIVTLWWGAATLGGTTAAVSTVLAWYPILAALVTAAATYGITHRLTGDVRCAIASVVMLAVTPAHAYRTALGYADHHAFDFMLLSLTALAVLVVVDERFDRDRPRLGVSLTGWTAIVGGGITVAAQAAAWRGGPLLLLPIAFYAVARAYFDLRADARPLRTTGPLIGLLTIGTVLSYGVHAGLGWLQPYRALAPALLLVGVVTVVTIAVVVDQLDLPAWTVFAGTAGIGAAGIGLVPLVVPPVARAVTEFGSYLARYGRSDIAETQSLFSQGNIVAPIFLFGLLFFIALPYLVWGTWRQVSQARRPDWLLVTSYAWWFFGLAIVQNRFTGELSPFFAVFAGIAFVHLAAWTDILQPLSLTDRSEDVGAAADGGIEPLSRLDYRTIGYLVVLFLLVGGLGIVQSSVKMQQIAVNDAEYETASWVGEYADDRGMTYPDNYVLSRWGSNRPDNYLVNGETESYGYALENYERFARSQTGDGWYEQFRNDDVGFIIVRPVAGSANGSVHSQLHDHYGSRTGQRPALTHYRALYHSTGGDIVAFEVVPGATVTGTASPGQTITAETAVTLPPQGTESTYARQVFVSQNGTYQFTTPYAGTYTVGNSTVTVSEAAVRNGRTVED